MCSVGTRDDDTRRACDDDERTLLLQYHSNLVGFLQAA